MSEDYVELNGIRIRSDDFDEISFYSILRRYAKATHNDTSSTPTEQASNGSDVYADIQLPRPPPAPSQKLGALTPEHKTTSKETILGRDVQGEYSARDLLKHHVQYLRQLSKWQREGLRLRRQRFRERLAMLGVTPEGNFIHRAGSSVGYSSALSARSATSSATISPPRSPIRQSNDALDMLSTVATSPAGRVPHLGHMKRGLDVSESESSNDESLMRSSGKRRRSLRHDDSNSIFR